MAYQHVKENGPDTLLDMCLSYCMNNLGILIQSHEESGPWDSSLQSLQPGLTFPTNISDNLFNYLTRNVSESWNVQCQDLIPVFSDTAKTPLTKVVIRQQIDLSEPGSQSLFNHPLNHLELTCCSFCDIFSYEIFQLIKKLRNCMRALKLWAKPNCPRCGSMSTTESVSKLTKIQESRDNLVPLISSNIADIRLLSVQNFKHREFTETPTMLKGLIEPLHSLCHLNLTGCGVTEQDLESIVNLPKITYLVLSGIQFDDVQEGFMKLGKASRLKHLDISCCSQEPKIYPNAVDLMSTLLEKLPSLTSLDISGTNLAGDRLHESVAHKLGPTTEEGSADTQRKCDSLSERQFEFLGLWNCPDLPFPWKDTPAKQFTGWENDDQILFSASVYLENEKMLTHVLNKLFGSLRVGPRPNKILIGVPTMLKAIQLHPLCREIQRSANACLFLMMNGKSQIVGQKTRTFIVETLISCVNQVKNDTYTAKCCVCSFLCLNMPHDAIYCHLFKRYVNCLLRVLNSYHGDFFEMYALKLLHEACRTERHEKEMIGKETDTLTYLLSLIRHKLASTTCDDTMERAWSCLWSLTDDMPINARCFMDEPAAMEIYMSCIQMFDDKDGLLKKMTGLMANLSEVRELRKNLRTEDVMTLFCALMDSTLDDDGVSYHAASVMSTMVTDPPSEWTIEKPKRSLVLSKIVEAVNRWDLDSKMKIKYRSLRPILELLAEYDTPEAQLWAAWALCNLTRSKADRYCAMLEAESGLPLLTKVKDDVQALPRIVELITMTIQTCSNFKSSRKEESPEEESTPAE